MKLEQRGKITALFSPEYIDLNFKKDLDALREILAGQEKIIIDFTEAELINSHGISALIKVLNWSKNKKISIYFSGIKTLMIKLTLTDTGLLWLCDGYEYASVEDAFRELS